MFKFRELGTRLRHWRQPRRGCWGHIPNILVGERQWEYPPNIITYFRTQQTDISLPPFAQADFLRL